jgi:hypothetical protein
VNPNFGGIRYFWDEVGMEKKNGGASMWVAAVIIYIVYWDGVITAGAWCEKGRHHDEENY